jgi:hypothetical protein
MSGKQKKITDFAVRTKAAINTTKFFNTTGRLDKFYKKTVQPEMDVS